MNVSLSFWKKKKKRTHKWTFEVEKNTFRRDHLRDLPLLRLGMAETLVSTSRPKRASDESAPVLLVYPHLVDT